jgi:hypothetical protein
MSSRQSENWNLGVEDIQDCQHKPRCGSASVHHARINMPKVSRPIIKWGEEARDVSSARLRQRALYLSAGLAPWEMTADEFAAAAEPWVDLEPVRLLSEGPSHRVFGMTVSMLRKAVRLRLVVRGGPEDGYEVDVPWEDQVSREDPRRAFVAEALAEGFVVPRHVLADYPDLQVAA